MMNSVTSSSHVHLYHPSPPSSISCSADRGDPLFPVDVALSGCCRWLVLCPRRQQLGTVTGRGESARWRGVEHEEGLTTATGARRQCVVTATILWAPMSRPSSDVAGRYHFFTSLPPSRCLERQCTCLTTDWLDTRRRLALAGALHETTGTAHSLWWRGGMIDLIGSGGQVGTQLEQSCQVGAFAPIKCHHLLPSSSSRGGVDVHVDETGCSGGLVRCDADAKAAV
ncbi:hypothetical protein B0I35DRAFT_5996 [Stachybotrys elegans]|uniref:Uncharacterized protein n=1 Tax=Stachybotrys elegans TaxID=80388 RepID=A0A8K0T4P2_9HYPO|nr:hypothetical protein B0I35DRAFT_5996 [Stachybotrys elegans]